MTKRIRNQTDRSPVENERLRAIREQYQMRKPTPEQVLAESGQSAFVPLGEVILLQSISAELRRERELLGVSLTELAARAAMDPAVLSRLETGKTVNPTVATLSRIAMALGKRLHCSLLDAPAEEKHEEEPVES